MDGGEVSNSFSLYFFGGSFIGDYGFQRDHQRAATRLDHQASEREGRGRNKEAGALRSRCKDATDPQEGKLN